MAEIKTVKTRTTESMIPKKSRFDFKPKSSVPGFKRIMRNVKY